MAQLMTLSPRAQHYPGDLIVACLSPGRRVPLDWQIVENYLPGLTRDSALSLYRSSPGIEVDEMAQQVCEHSTPNSNVLVVRDALQLILRNIAKMRNTGGADRVRRPLQTWLGKSVVFELETRDRRPADFRETLNRFRGLVAISNAFASEYIAAVLYDFFASHYGIQICAASSKKAAFRFALLLFSLRLLSDADVLSSFRQIVRGNPSLFNRQVRMSRFANPRSADIWRLIEWVGGHWDAVSFDGLPEGLSRVMNLRRHPRLSPPERWHSQPRPRPLSWDVTDVVARPRLPPRLYTTGSLHGRRSENAIMDIADQVEQLDTRLASLENDHDRVVNTQENMVDYMANPDRYHRDVDGDSDWYDKWA
ncbi:MAG: hypothetical protein Q9165_003388 [Trypethelium subeluteriae]